MTTSFTRFGSIFAMALALAAAGCTAREPGVSEEAIVGGAVETGYNAVYYIINQRGGACTASLISPRVVLTARHCVVDSTDGPAPARYFRVYVGWSQRTFVAEYRVSAVHIIPGSTGVTGDAQDLGILVLASPAAEMALEMARDVAAGGLVNTDATSIGFGQTPSGGSGTKIRGIAHVVGLEGGFIFVDPSVCSGDSGGPLLGADGRVYGVASFIYSPDRMSEPRCGTAPGAYNEIFPHMAWIESILESVGDECLPDPEVCDGLDNDCNGVVDDPCLALGAPCTTNDECGSLLCGVVGGARVCTQECDPALGELGCGLGMYCSVSGCSGLCAVGPLGTTGVGSDCTTDVECASGFCRDPGDGVSRCLQPCARDLAQCLGGEVCVPFGGASCGGCVDGRIVGGGRGLGEPCTAGSECSSGQCVIRAGLGECAAPCGAGSSCSDGFVCRDGVCLVDRRQPIGGSCAENADCQTGLCAALGAVHWCTALCTSDAGCPGSFHCDAAASVCAPDLALDGEACALNEDCVSGLCATLSGGGACVSVCDAERRCGVGLECRRAGDGTTAVCTRPPSHAGSCAAGRDRRAGSGAAAFGGLVLALVLARRRCVPL